MKAVAVICFGVLVSLMLIVSSLALGRSGRYHTRTLFFFNEVSQRKEGVFLVQKHQKSKEDDVKIYLSALLHKPLDVNLRPLFTGNVDVHSVYILDGKSVVSLTWPNDLQFKDNISESMSLIEYSLNFNFPRLKPFSVVINGGEVV